VIVAIVAKLKVAVEGVIVDVKALASLPHERILCTLVGGALDGLSIAKLLASLCNVGGFNFSFRLRLLTPLQLVFGAFGSILGVVAGSVKVQILPLLSEVGCLVGSLLCAVLGLVNSLVSEIIVCLLPRMTGCLSVIKLLDVKIIIAVLGLKL
jgi:hypothetical protein